MALRRSVLGFLLAASVGLFGASPAAADYGRENWQIGFAGTGVAAGTGQSFGFWGWCAFGGGVTSGNTGDCNFAQYFHSTSGGSFTCHEDLDITAWNTAGGSFHITGTAGVTPTGATLPCLAFFPGSSTFTNVDSGIPAAAGHYNFGGLGPGLRGEFQIQVTQLK
jgi:hypothetical protein